MQAASQLQGDNEHDRSTIAGRLVEVRSRREGGHFVSEVRCAVSGELLARGEGPARLEAEVIARAKAEDLLTRHLPAGGLRRATGRAAQRSLCPTA